MRYIENIMPVTSSYSSVDSVIVLNNSDFELHHDNAFDVTLRRYDFFLLEDSGWTLEISANGPIKLEFSNKVIKEIEHSKKRLINVHNNGNKWFHIRPLNPAS